jgi:hypothetical protein
MTWVVAGVAMGGSALLGAGGSIAGGLIGANASKKAAGQQESALYAQFGQQQSARDQMLQYFDPFRQMGLQAGQALTGELYSPQQQTQQAQSSIDSLNRQMGVLRQQMMGYRTGQGVPILQGDRASERRAVVWNQMIQQNEQQQAAIKDQLATQQSQLANAKTQAANPNAQAEQLQNNPMYTAGANVVGRHLAAQGLQGSQEAIRQEGTLAATVYQNQIQNQLGIYQPSVGAAGQMAGNIGNLGMQMGQTLGNVGQVQAQGTIGAANSWQQMASGIGNAASGAIGGALNYSLFNKLMGNMNTGSGGGGGSQASLNTNWSPAGRAAPGGFGFGGATGAY